MNCTRPECQTTVGCAHRSPHGAFCWFPDSDRSSKCWRRCTMGKYSKEEITPEMIEAGVAALVEFNRNYEREESAVVRIYGAMRSKAKVAASARTARVHSPGSSKRVQRRPRT